jgi:hypothetical protein
VGGGEGMTFTFDIAPVLARIREREAAIAAIPAKAKALPPAPFAEIAALAAGRGCRSISASPPTTPDLDRYEELAAILEYDQGLPRAAAEMASAEAQGYRDGAALLAAHEALGQEDRGRAAATGLAATRTPAPARHGVLVDGIP